MEEKERYINLCDRQIKDTQDHLQAFMGISSVCKRLNQQDKRIKELENDIANYKYISSRSSELVKENQQLKDQVKKSYQEGLLQKQFDKDMEIQELKDKIEELTTYKEIINKNKPAFCKLAGRDCEWLEKEKQLAINELEKVKGWVAKHAREFWTCENDDLDVDLYDFINNQIKKLGGGKNDK